MNLLKYKRFIFTLFLLLPILSFGQKIEKLKNLSTWKKQDIYIQTKRIDSAEQHLVYLINRSGKDQEFYGVKKGRFIIYTQAQDSSGNWTRIDHRLYDPHSYIKYYPLQKDHYAWRKIDYVTGDFKTKARYYIELKDSTVYSKPFSAYVPSYSFGTFREYKEGYWDEKINRKDINQSQKIYYMMQKAGSITSFFKDFDEAILIVKQCIELDPNSEKAHFFLGKLYQRKISTCYKMYSEEALPIVISACLEQLNKANEVANFKNEDIKKEIKKFRKRFQKIIPRKSTFNKDQQFDCIEVDGKIKCFEPCFVKDYVEITFRN